jgi:hypothetical protein
MNRNNNIDNMPDVNPADQEDAAYQGMSTFIWYFEYET